MTTETTAEAVQQTLAEYERIAISTGDTVQIDPPEFWSGRTDEEWAPFWMLKDPPEFGRATVHRDGVPTTVYVSWLESVPAVEDWRALWERKPMKLFGAYTLRAALRRAFRDVIGDRREPDERDDAPATPAEPHQNRDWLVELSETETEDDVSRFHKDAKAARVVSVDLERAIRQRLVEVRAGLTADKPAPPKVPKLAEGGIVSPHAVVAAADGIEHIVPLGKPHAVTPADLAAALAKRPAPAAQKPRAKNGHRPQKPKPRGPRA